MTKNYSTSKTARVTGDPLAGITSHSTLTLTCFGVLTKFYEVAYKPCPSKETFWMLKSLAGYLEVQASLAEHGQIPRALTDMNIYFTLTDY